MQFKLEKNEKRSLFGDFGGKRVGVA